VVQARQLLQRAVQASRHHFNREESIVFPLAEKTLKTKTLQQLGAGWASRRQAAA
jgi:hemerythrin-like domain-containing protein